MKVLNFFLLLMLVVLSCCGFAAAAEVRLDGTQLVVAGVEDSLGLGAFTVVLEYGSNVSVTSVSGLSGFMIIGNIRNDRQMTVIGGITGNNPGPTGDVAVAEVRTEGNDSVSISVIELTNANGDPISYSNPTFTGTIPTPEGETPIETTVPATTQTSTASSSAGQTGATGGNGATVPSEKPPLSGESVTAETTAATVSASSGAETMLATGTMTTEIPPVQQPKTNATPLSPFVLLLALVSACITYRMINKS